MAILDPEKIHIRNKRASFDYEFVETMVCGMILSGTEIKSIRQGKASISEAHCVFQKKELWIKNMNIAEYTEGNIQNHEPMRARKLLAKKQELKKWREKVREKGLTIVPLRVFINKRGFAKIEIALAKGKKTHDKRESLKEKDAKKKMDRIMKSY